MFHQKWGFFVTFLFLCQLSSNLVQGPKSGGWLILQAQKVVLGTTSDNMAQKPLFYAYFWRFFDQTPLRYIIAMATPKIPSDQKLLERVCKKQKSRSFCFLYLNDSELYKKTAGGGGQICPTPIQNRVKLNERVAPEKLMLALTKNYTVPRSSIHSLKIRIMSNPCNKYK